MGYQRKRKIYRLVFEGEYAGLEVNMRGLTTGEFLEIASMGNKTGDEDSQETVELLTTLADHLISWNMLDEEDQPVPADFEGVKSNELALNMKIIDAWTGAVGGVADPLPVTSTSGAQFPVVSVPMEALSESLLPLSEPNGSSGPVAPSTFSPAQS